MAGNPIDFVEVDAEASINRMVANYEAATGKVLQAAQPERLLINSAAYEIMLVRESVNYAANQNLVDNADAPALDELGALLGVTRLPAAPAQEFFTATVVVPSSGYVIPAGTRIRSTDGRAIFETTEQLDIDPNVATGIVLCECMTEGPAGNGYAAGAISDIMDPQAFLISLTNNATTSGGADVESDDNLRARIKLAPGSFSTAGPVEAYKFWARTASSLIIDVEVISPVPGTVNLYPLMADGSITPAPILAAVLAVCNADKIRPICDIPVAVAPTRIDYALTVDVTIYDWAIGPDVQAAIQAVLAPFVLKLRQSLGNDIVQAQLIAKSIVAGVYKAVVDNGTIATDIICAKNQYAYCNSITVNIVGTNVG